MNRTRNHAAVSIPLPESSLTCHGRSATKLARRGLELTDRGTLGIRHYPGPAFRLWDSIASQGGPVTRPAADAAVGSPTTSIDGKLLAMIS